MSDRVTELLLKAVRGLPEQEQDEVLAGLLTAKVTSGPTGRTVAARWIRPLGTRGRGPVPAMPPDVRALDDVMVTQLALDTDAELRVLPVRLPVTDYERLRAFSREHGFSMAVIIRTLLERFLEGQEPTTDEVNSVDGPAPGP
jgi:hypothetical protein